MKRDKELMKGILERVRDGESLDIDGYSEEQAHYHTSLLLDDGLMTGKREKKRMGESVPRITHLLLTTSGHDHLEQADLE